MAVVGEKWRGEEPGGQGRAIAGAAVAAACAFQAGVVE